MKTKLSLIIIIFLCFGLQISLKSQIVEYNHPELKWLSIETEHFFVHFHPGAERTAKVVAKISEDIHKPLCTFYKYEPDTKVHWIIRDHEDYSNGVTYYYDNKIEIWATPMDFELRGTHNWLRNVITHEYTHMINLGAARKLMRQIPAIYFQMIDYEVEKRPDVLFGFPNKIISYPLAMTVVPMWLAEGTAQYQLPILNYENWDTHRDMILRTAVVQDYLLTMNQMGVFEKNGVGSEMVYDHGYSLVHFIANKYGVQALSDIMNECSSPWNLTFNRASKKVLKVSEKELYKDWKNTMEKMYAERLHLIQQNVVQGEIIFREGTGNLYPTWSPDGKRVAFLSNRGRDYLSQTSLYIYDFETQNAKLVKSAVGNSISWSPDGKKIIYASKRKIDKHGSHYFDLYLYDLDTKKEKQLTENKRVHSPDWSAASDKIVCVNNHDGSNNLLIYDLEKDSLTTLTNYNQGEQVYNPHWSNNGKVIIYGFSRANTQDILLISSDGKTMRTLIADEFDSRNPVFSPNDQEVVFSYDKTGIYNLYSMNIKTGDMKQLTNVIGGAFMPTVNKRNQITYSLFDKGQYTIAYLKEPAQVDPKTTQYLDSHENFYYKTPDEQIKSFNLEEIADGQYDDTKLPDYEVGDFKNSYSKISFLPRVMLDYKSGNRIRVGSYFYSSDVLNRYSILGGFAVNKSFEYDAFASFEYRKFWPTLFFEVYAFRLKTSSLEKIITKKTNIDYFYQLLEIDTGARFKVNDMMDLSLTYINSRYRAKQEYIFEDVLNKFSYNYYMSHDVALDISMNGMIPYIDSEIHPIGRRVDLRYDYEMSKFITGFKISQYSTIVPDFEPNNFSRIQMDWEEYWGLFSKRHRIGMHFQGGFIEKPVNSFLNFFAGGLIYMRGYPYYSMEGRKLVNLKFLYYFQILKNMDIRLLHFYFDKVFGGVFFDYGNAFDQNNLKEVDFKRDAGWELRLNTTSFYGYPAYFFVSGAYGLNQFQHEGQIYGKEWRYYFGLSFGYFN